MRITSGILLLATLVVTVAGAPPVGQPTSANSSTVASNRQATKSDIKAGLPGIQARFHDQQIVRLAIANSKSLAAVRAKIDGLELDVWRESKSEIDVRVDGAEKAALARIPGVQLKVIAQDVQALVDRERTANNKLVAGPNDWFTKYHPLDELIGWYSTLAKDNPTLVSTPKPIGASSQGRQLVKLRITAPGDASGRKRIWIEGLQHAREWISPATVQYIAYALVEAYKANDARVVALLKQVEFVFLPVVNPDGYVYTWESNRLWRKNREKNAGSSSYGVDLNRNWPDHWDYPGSSTSPSSDTYRGPSPGSSKEVAAAIASYLEEDNVVGAIDYHSYSQLILRPYGWTDSNSPDDDAISAVASQIAKDIKSVNGLDYTSERVVDLYYAAGNVGDWWYGQASDIKAKAGRPAPRPYAFGIELRPDSDSDGVGFILPPDQILPTGRENYAAVLTFAEQASRNPLPDASKNPGTPVKNTKSVSNTPTAA